jgi:hypothetical protein
MWKNKIKSRVRSSATRMRSSASGHSIRCNRSPFIGRFLRSFWLWGSSFANGRAIDPLSSVASSKTIGAGARVLRSSIVLENPIPGPLLQLWFGSVLLSSRVVPPRHLSPSSLCIPKHLGLHHIFTLNEMLNSRVC